MKRPLTYLALTLGFMFGFLYGNVTGQDKIYDRDHVQASRGFFMDGAEGGHNALYRIVPLDLQAMDKVSKTEDRLPIASN